MVYLGANIYYWGNKEQTRLLLNGVRPWNTRAREAGLIQRFWYCRYDARGPHLFILFATQPESQADLQTFLEAEVESFLRSNPSTEFLSREELEKRHRDCRGRTMSVADSGQLLADNNSFVVFSHQDSAYPLHLSAGMTAAEEFWNRLDVLASWALEQLETDTTRTAVRWFAAVDHSLRRAGLSPQEYWRFHACTLLLPLKQRLQTDEAAVLAALPRTIGENNRTLFAHTWREMNNGCNLGFDVGSLVRLIVNDEARSLERRFATLREINHVLMGQLGQWTKFEIPIVLHAWQQNLSG